MNTRFLLSFTFALSVAAALPSEARADEPAIIAPTSPRAAEVAPPVWYGWQTLSADGVSAVVMSTGIALSSSPNPGGTDAARGLLVGGVGIFALGAPAVHLANGEPWAAAGSLGLRVVLPTVGFFVGLASAPHCPVTNDSWGPCLRGLDSAAIGALVGMIGASVADASLLAYKTKPKGEPKIVATLGLVPQIDPVHGTYTLNLVGAGF
jgi:hypothetical protein